MRINKEFRFEAAHRLPCHAGACSNLHGHSYKVVVHVESHYYEENLQLQQEGPATGMIMDFKTLSNVVRGILDRGEFKGQSIVPWDHAVILYEKDPLRELLMQLDLPGTGSLRVVTMEKQPTAENMALLLGSLIQEGLEAAGETDIGVAMVEVWETETSCAIAEW